MGKSPAPPHFEPVFTLQSAAHGGSTSANNQGSADTAALQRFGSEDNDSCIIRLACTEELAMPEKIYPQ